MTIEDIKKLGKDRSEENLNILLKMYKQDDLSVEQKREVVSSIGRQKNKERVYKFIKENAFKKNYMDVIYQMYRTILYNYEDVKFQELGDKLEKFYNNEMIFKMKEFYLYKKRKKDNVEEISKCVNKPTLLEGDCRKTMKKIKDKSVSLIFTSPPYYNAREYTNYKSYKDYLKTMKEALKECYRILEDGRFIIINVSPVITKRPGREFESIRYPIHFDFHQILQSNGFYFVDEIIWIKPEYSVPNRNGGFQQTRLPLTYKPNCITESVLVYRKQNPFLIDKTVKNHKEEKIDINENIDMTNCWYISPKTDKNHPAVFPEELCKRIIKYYSFENEVVLDPFAGSGIFGETAQKMNRVPILCEMKDEYINILKGRGYHGNI